MLHLAWDLEWRWDTTVVVVQSCSIASLYGFVLRTCVCLLSPWERHRSSCYFPGGCCTNAILCSLQPDSRATVVAGMTTHCGTLRLSLPVAGRPDWPLSRFFSYRGSSLDAE